MNTIIVDYKHGLGAFLDELGITWRALNREHIEIEYSNPDTLFTLGYEFAKFQENLN